jgi:hypothetical protein
MSHSIEIESHPDDSVTLTIGHVRAHISADSWHEANRAANALGLIIQRDYECADMRQALYRLRKAKETVSVACGYLETVVKGLID